MEHILQVNIETWGALGGRGGTMSHQFGVGGVGCVESQLAKIRPSTVAVIEHPLCLMCGLMIGHE